MTLAYNSVTTARVLYIKGQALAVKQVVTIGSQQLIIIYSNKLKRSSNILPASGTMVLVDDGVRVETDS